MRLLRPSLGLAILLALAAAGVAVAAAAVITPTRVDGVHLGDTHADLRARGKVGPIRPGCELGGPNTRSAKLKAPLKGSVNYTLSSPRKVDSITITGGAKARGVGIGASIAQIKAKFPRAKVDHSTDQVFQLTLVRTPKRPHGRGRITFGVSTQTKRTTIIGVPFIAFCE
ncbi:MAG TPA: hypothetical protein VJT68_05330 [Thermoleophilaceae bacterium]|nr:hypothetical protein [Thermoleophilaceae bacterium]